jgi:hypothetical protein
LYISLQPRAAFFNCVDIKSLANFPKKLLN